MRIGGCGSAIQARDTNAALGVLTPLPLEASLVSKIELIPIKIAYTDQGVRGLRLSSTRGGERRKPAPPTDAVEIGRIAVGGTGEACTVAQQPVLVIFHQKMAPFKMKRSNLK